MQTLINILAIFGALNLIGFIIVAIVFIDLKRVIKINRQRKIDKIK